MLWGSSLTADMQRRRSIHYENRSRPIVHAWCTWVNIYATRCHNSTFSPLSGDVVSGPADKPLAKLQVEIRDSKVFYV